MNRLSEYLLVIALATSGAYAYSWINRKAEIPPGVTVEAKPAQEIKDEAPTVAIKPPVVKVYKPGTKGKLKLPASVIADNNRHVLASSQTAADERPHTVTTVIDSMTGEVQTFDRADPLPWMAVNTKSEIGAYVGYKHGEPAVRIEGRQELLQVKALHMGAIASADVTRMGTDGFIGVGMWARW